MIAPRPASRLDVGRGAVDRATLAESIRQDETPSRRLLGHHSWEFTAGTYLHLNDDDLPDGAIVGDLVGGGAAMGEPLARLVAAGAGEA
jgi:hypothetical protein